MVLINRFGQIVVQNYVESNGGGRGIKSKASGVCGRPLQKKRTPLQKKGHFSWGLCEIPTFWDSESGQLTLCKSMQKSCTIIVFLKIFKIANPKLMSPRRQTSFRTRGTTPGMLYGARGTRTRSPVAFAKLFASRSDRLHGSASRVFSFAISIGHSSRQTAYDRNPYKNKCRNRLGQESL